MAYIRGTADYNLGGLGTAPSRFSRPSLYDDSTGDPSPLERIREQTSKIEDVLETVSHPLKPYVDAHVDVLLS